jgi:heme exporter protein C
MTAIPTVERALRRSGLWMGIALVLVGGVYVRALAYTPEEVTQGLAQKIFYIHAPSAWVAFLAFGIVGVCSLLYLFLRDPRLDLCAASSAEVGTVFTTVVLVTGPIWGKTIWGAWWTWDARR